MANSILATDVIRDKQSKEDIEVKNIAFTGNDGELKALNGMGLSVQNAKTLNNKTIEDIETNYKSYVDNSLSSIKDKSLGNIRLIQEDNNSCISNSFLVFVSDDEEIRIKGRNNYFLKDYVEAYSGFITLDNPHKQSKIKQILAYGLSLYVLYEDGELYTMGQNIMGYLGVGNTAEQYSLIYSASNVKKVFSSSLGVYCNNRVAFILKDNNELFSCGCNEFGQLGLGHNTNKYSWEKVPFLDDIGEIKDVILTNTKYGASYILTTNGELLACGYNGFGNLGFNDTINRNTFQKIPALANTKIIQLMASGGYYSGESTSVPIKNDISCLALSSKGELFAWGSNNFGQLGTSDTAQKNNPVLVLINLEDNETIEKIYPSKASTNFYLKTSLNNLYGSGNNAYGQLNTPNTTQSNLFIKIFENVKDIHITSALQFSYTATSLFVITNDNKLFVFGANHHGSLGLGHKIHIKEAVENSFINPNKIKQISSGGENTTTIYILLENGQIYSSGCNNKAQIIYPGNHSVTRFIRIF